MKIGIMDNMTLEFYKKIYNTKIQKYKSMYLIKTKNEVLLVKSGKKVCFTNKEYLMLKELLKM